MFSEIDRYWMLHAIALAKLAAAKQEVPVGAVLIMQDKILGEGFNSPISDCDPCAHAEIIALRQGGKHCNNYRLTHSTLYVTLEPCIMCVGAIVHARIQRVVFGAYDPKAGAVESVFQLGKTKQLNHQIIYEGGLLADQCGKILIDFFRACRVGKAQHTHQLRI